MTDKKKENRKCCKARDKMPLAKLACFEFDEKKSGKENTQKEVKRIIISA